MAAQHSWCRMQPPACTHAQARARAPVLEGAVNLLALASLHPHTAHGHALRVKPACGCVWLRVVACETGRLPHAAARVVAACVGRGAGGRGGGGPPHARGRRPPPAPPHRPPPPPARPRGPPPAPPPPPPPPPRARPLHGRSRRARMARPHKAAQRVPPAPSMGTLHAHTHILAPACSLTGAGSRTTRPSCTCP
jgi:hypothetical protein